MSSRFTSAARRYFWGSLIMFLGLIYNLIEQDLFGSAIFLFSSVTLLSIGFAKSRA